MEIEEAIYNDRIFLQCLYFLYMNARRTLKLAFYVVVIRTLPIGKSFSYLQSNILRMHDIRDAPALHTLLGVTLVHHVYSYLLIKIAT